MAMKKKKALLKTRLKDNTVAGIHPETETSQVVDLADKYYNKSQVDTKLSGKMNTIAIDNTPTDGSTNLITSDGVYDAIQGFIEQPDVTNALTPCAKIVYVDTKLNTKQDKLTFDSAPTDASNNPVTSGGIFNAIKNKADKSELTNFVNTTALNAALLAKQDVLTFDESPTDGSDNPVKSKGIFNTLKSYAKKSELPTKTSELTNDSGFLTAHQDISGKQDKLTFDEAPTSGSDNPVKSKGIKGYVDIKTDALSAGKADKSEVPTKTSQLTNDSGFLTTHQDISGKQDKLTFDDNPTSGSDNPVKSKGIKGYVDAAISGVNTNLSTNHYTKTEVNIELAKKLDASDFEAMTTATVQQLWNEVTI